MTTKPDFNTSAYYTPAAALYDDANAEPDVVLNPAVITMASPE